MQYKQLIGLAALGLATLTAQASLTPLNPGDWPPIAGDAGAEFALFNTRVSRGVTLALGAHAYKQAASLANDDDRVFFADAGTYPSEPGRPTWSFDFFYDRGDCAICEIFLRIDTDPTDGTTFVVENLTNQFGAIGRGSWNMATTFGGGGYDPFDPLGASTTTFELFVRGPDETGGISNFARVDIDVVVAAAVPEPSGIALVGLALAGLGYTRRRGGKN